MRFPLDVMLVCIRWYAAYPLSYRHPEEMMEEHGVLVVAEGEFTGIARVNVPACIQSGEQAPLSGLLLLALFRRYGTCRTPAAARAFPLIFPKPPDTTLSASRRYDELSFHRTGAQP